MLLLIYLTLLEAVAEASSTINSATGHMLTFTAKDRGTGGEGLTASITLSALDATGNNGTLPLSYGATSGTVITHQQVLM